MRERKRRKGERTGRDGRNEMNEVMMKVTSFCLIFSFSKVNGIVKLLKEFTEERKGDITFIP